MSRARAELATREGARSGRMHTRMYVPTNSQVTRSSVLTYLRSVLYYLFGAYDNWLLFVSHQRIQPAKMITLSMVCVHSVSYGKCLCLAIQVSIHTAVVIW